MRVSRINWILLLCNVALLASGAYLWMRKTSQGDVPSLPAGSGPSAIHVQPETKVASGPEVVVVTNQFRWRQLETEDYRAYIARLRAIGCPEQTIRDIVIADLDKLMAPRVEAI